MSWQTVFSTSIILSNIWFSLETKRGLETSSVKNRKEEEKNQLPLLMSKTKGREKTADTLCEKLRKREIVWRQKSHGEEAREREGEEAWKLQQELMMGAGGGEGRREVSCYCSLHTIHSFTFSRWIQCDLQLLSSSHIEKQASSGIIITSSSFWSSSSSPPSLTYLYFECLDHRRVVDRRQRIESRNTQLIIIEGRCRRIKRQKRGRLIMRVDSKHFYGIQIRKNY